MSAPKAPHPDPASQENEDHLKTQANGITRRGFLKGAGLTAAGTALLDGVYAFSEEAARSENHGVTVIGPEPASIKLNVNGKEHAVNIEPRTTLAEALRNQLGMTGTKVICDRGSCSGCTVWLDKKPVNSCMTLAVDAVGHQVTTIEGISENGSLHPLQAAFVKHDALQCGFCTPGMVMSCAALLESNPNPTENDVRHAIAGNLCRCGTYPRIFSATLEVAGSNRKA
ncbi:(2Fe-2S)-binding protein [Alloacidobacterium sp.]|uniref:(2Fe-2S)-binding protein n=1 Tax=Alloacidobacterium sp. TaxID=2951999 RepID=UPI002D52F25F|nr:(2Fe-2S)-binding protein [Alloacidobacterium sp.]HYK37868.1 (2Fe-2S)-binding protein [Alloacidobacterium sp.]